MHHNENGNFSYLPISGTTFIRTSNNMNKNNNSSSSSLHSSTVDQQSSSYQSGSGNIEHHNHYHNNQQQQQQQHQQQLQQQQQHQNNQNTNQQHQLQLNYQQIYRYGQFSRQNTMASSLAAIGDSMSEILSDDVQNATEPTSMILSYCKRNFLRPYVLILGIVGLQPQGTDTTFIRSFLSYFQAIIVLFMLTCGYVMQYLSLFRGDRAFGTQRSSIVQSHNLQYITPNIGELVFGYIIPSGLHLAGYISAIIVFKIANNEHLQNLVERVFLMATRPKRLCYFLWFYIVGGFLWTIILLVFVIVLASTETEIIQIDLFGRFEENMQYTAKILLVLCLFIYDFVQTLVLMSYCVECLLLRFHLITLSQKFVQHTIESIDWMREILEFRKLLNHLNNRIAIPVCFFTMMNLSYAFAGLVYLFKDFDFHFSPYHLVVLNVVNVTIWFCMGLLPFFQAASLTRVCYSIRANGHQIRVRPFVYHNTSAEDLNSTLLFASSLNMSAKLFRMPIQVNYLCFAILVVSIFILTFGMCLNLHWGENV